MLIFAPEGQKHLKVTQIPASWLIMWLDNFDVISTEFQLLLKLHSHISVSWRFCRISMISKISSLDIGPKTKTQKSRKICIFGSIKFKYMWICFSITISTFWALKLEQTNKQTKKNSHNKKTKKNKKKTQTQFNKSRGVRISWKRNIAHD